MKPDRSGFPEARRNAIVLVALLFLSFLILLLSTRSLTGMPERIGLTVASVFQYSFYKVSDTVGSTVNAVGELRTLRRDYADAISRLEQYENIERNFADVKEENRRLREQLGLPDDPHYRKVSASIIAKDPENLFSSIVVNKGIKDGIRKNYPVIAFQSGVQGLVGRVVEVGYATSIITPIYDKNSFVAARLDVSRYEGLVEGNGEREQTLALKYVKKSALETVQFGDLVITSGLSGLYPEGITIGRVGKRKDQSFKTSVDFEVEPVIDFARLEMIFIVIPREAPGI